MTPFETPTMQKAPVKAREMSQKGVQKGVQKGSKRGQKGVKMGHFGVQNGFRWLNGYQRTLFVHAGTPSGVETPLVPQNESKMGKNG